MDQQPNAETKMQAVEPPEGWQPVFTKWRHGGWYVNNVRYPSGAVGCVSNNYPDRKWRIACDPRRGSDLGGPDDFTFPTRDAAARAEYRLAKGDISSSKSRPDDAREMLVQDEDIDTSEIPELGESFFSNAVLTPPGERLTVAATAVVTSGRHDGLRLVVVADLCGAALDWAVAKCEGHRLTTDGISQLVEIKGRLEIVGPVTAGGRPCGYSPSSFWSDGGPIIDRERLHLAPVTYNGEPSWQSWVDGTSSTDASFGPISLIAAMRSYVTSKFGERLEVPTILLR